MCYYIGRALGINDNSRPLNSDIPTPFYSHLLRVLREFAVYLGQLTLHEQNVLPKTY
jgi:hypothetical protein